MRQYKSQIIINKAIHNGRLHLYAADDALPYLYFNFLKLNLILDLFGLESELLRFDQPKVVFEGADGVQQYVPEAALVGGESANIILVTVGDSSSYGHDEHLEADECILGDMMGTSRENMISRWLKLGASWSKQLRMSFSNITITIFCQKVKKMVILMVRNLSSAE
ncbi:unnamed protein product [Sphagnum balticum]